MHSYVAIYLKYNLNRNQSIYISCHPQYNATNCSENTVVQYQGWMYNYINGLLMLLELLAVLTDAQLMSLNAYS